MVDQPEHNMASIMEIMREVEAIYTDSSGDCNDIAETNRIRKVIEETYSQRQSDAKSLIKGIYRLFPHFNVNSNYLSELSSSIEETKNRAIGDHVEAHQRRIAELQQQKENVELNIKTLEESKAKCLSSIDQNKAVCTKLCDELDSKEADRVADVPRIK